MRVYQSPFLRKRLTTLLGTSPRRRTSQTAHRLSCLQSTGESSPFVCGPYSSQKPAQSNQGKGRIFIPAQMSPPPDKQARMEGRGGAQKSPKQENPLPIHFPLFCLPQTCFCPPIRQDTFSGGRSQGGGQQSEETLSPDRSLHLR